MLIIDAIALAIVKNGDDFKHQHIKLASLPGSTLRIPLPAHFINAATCDPIQNMQILGIVNLTYNL